jgi:hypothetical protein
MFAFIATQHDAQLWIIAVGKRKVAYRRTAQKGVYKYRDIPQRLPNLAGDRCLPAKIRVGAFEVFQKRSRRIRKLLVLGSLVDWVVVAKYVMNIIS